MRNRSNSIFLWNKIVQILAECPSSQSKPPYCLMISTYMGIFFCFLDICSKPDFDRIQTEKVPKSRAKNRGVLICIFYANFFIFYLYWFLFFFYSICSTYWQNSNIKGAKNRTKKSGNLLRIFYAIKRREISRVHVRKSLSLYPTAL